MMSFCTKCGMELEEGVVHHCAAKQTESAATAEAAFAVTPPQGFTFDMQIVRKLLGDPFTAMELQDQEFLYGIGGIVLSILGFFLWGYALQKSIVASILSSVNRNFGDFMGNSMNSTAVVGKMNSVFPINSDLFWIGFLSICFLFLSVWFISNLKGSSKISFKRMIAVYGSAQIFPALGYIVSAIVAFLSMKYSFFLLVVALLIAFIVTILIGLEMTKIVPQKRFSAISITLTVYLLLLSFVVSTMLAKYPEILRNFGNQIF